MIKNNIKSLLLHIVISILSLIIFLIFHASAVKWASEEAARRHHVYMLLISAAVIIVSLFLYYYFGRKLLSYQENFFRSIISLSLTALIGIGLWFTAFYIDLTGGTEILLNSQLWQLFSSYYGYCLYLVDELAIGSPYIMLVFVILPIIAMYLGISKKKSTIVLA